MLPKKSKDIIESVYDNIEDKKLAKDLVDYVFSELRTSMSNLDNIVYNFHCFRFFTTKKLVMKEKSYVSNIINERRNLDCIGFYKGEWARLINLQKLLAEDDKRFEEAINRKLEWHKKNGDPYGVYKRKLEADSNRAETLPEEE